MSKLQKAALAYAAQGWPIFPCNAQKEPYTDRGVIDATTNPKQIEEWWGRWPRANIGLHVGAAGMMVLDLDPGHSVEDLESSIGKLPKTKLAASTPRGGKHLFYEIDESETVPPSASKIAPHVDVRSFHSYVLLAPSKTPDGEYSWEGEGKPAYRSDGMIEAAQTAHTRRSEDHDTWIIDRDLPENIEAATEWLLGDAEIAVEGQGGDHTAYATAAMMKSYGLSPETAFDLMWEHWNPRCDPPWSADEADHLETKVLNGYSYNTSPPGNMTRSYKEAKKKQMFAPRDHVIPTGRELMAGRFRFVDREGIKHIRPPEWIIDGLLPSEGYAMMYGQPGTFKTFVALDMALSIATGFPVNPIWTVSKPGPVLYVAGEGRSGISNRIKGWEQLHWAGEEVENFVLADPVPLVSEEREGFYEGAKEMYPNGYRLVVLDTVGRAMQGLNENAQENASAFTQLVQEIQFYTGATVLALHHTGHDGKTSRPRGSSVFGADVDAMFSLERKDKSLSVLFSNPKQKDAPEHDPVVIKLVEAPVDGVKTLVASAVSKKEAKEAKEDKKAAAENDEDLMKRLDNAALNMLKKIPGRVWSGRELANAMAMDPLIEGSPGGKSIANRYLPILRENREKYKAGHHCDPMTMKWRYVKGEEDEK